jgi:hypothetical protein
MKQIAFAAAIFFALLAITLIPDAGAQPQPQSYQPVGDVLLHQAQQCEALANQQFRQMTARIEELEKQVAASAQKAAPAEPAKPTAP